MEFLEVNKNFTLNPAINGPLLSAVFAMIMVTGLVANLFVIFLSVFYSKSWKRPSTIYLTSLLLADLVIMLVLPFSIISTATGEWIFGRSVEEKHIICQLAAYLFWYCALLITMMLFVISIDRFLFIVKPLFYRRHVYMKPQIAVTVVIIVWIICALLNSTPLYGLGVFHFSESHGFCTPGWEGQLPYVVYMVMLIGILVTSIAVTSIWSCCSTHKFLTRAQCRLTNTFKEKESDYTSKKRTVIGIFGALLLVNAICFIPSIFVAFLAIFLSLPGQVYATVITCSLFIVIGNPVVQILFREDIKSAVRKLHATICKR